MNDPQLEMHARCAECGLVAVVVPHGALGSLLELAPVDDTRQLASQLSGLRDGEGRAFVVARADGSFACPGCDARG
jgi:hypothetical protein